MTPLQRRRRLAVTTAVVALLAVGCLEHAAPNTTPQAAIAHYGADTIRAINAVQDFVIAGSDGGTIPLATAEPIMDRTARALIAGQRLSVALKVYDASTTGQGKADAKVAITQAITDITTAIGAGFGNLFPSNLAGQALELVTQISATVNLIKASAGLP